MQSLLEVKNLRTYFSTRGVKTIVMIVVMALCRAGAS